MRQRDVVFDIMKGIGIILVLVGHFPDLNECIKRFIYSFHIPLFFLLAGYFTKSSESLSITVSKNAKRLLLPFVFTQLLIIGWCIIIGLAKDDFTPLHRSFLSLLWGSGDIISSSYGDIYVGPLWFLSALFIGKTLISTVAPPRINLYKYLLFSVLISISAILLRKITLSPWSLLQGVSASLFLAMGWLARNVSIPRWVYILLICCWPLALVFSTLDMYACYFKCLPLDVLGACGGTIVIYHIAKSIAKIPVLSKILSLCGVYSLVILCFHSFDWFTHISWTILDHSPISLNENEYTVFRFFFAFVLSFIAVKTPIIREIYGVYKIDNGKKKS